MDSNSNNSIKLISGWIFLVASTVWITLILFISFVVNTEAGRELLHIKTDAEFWKSFQYFIPAAGFGPIALILAFYRIRISTIQTRHDRDKALNELFSKAIDQLGAKNGGEALKQGAIYTLQALMNDLPNFRNAIIRIVVAYVRISSNSIKKKYNQLESAEQYKYTMPGSVESAVNLLKDTKDLIDNNTNFDLSNSFFVNVDFTGVNFTGYNLSDCKFIQCILKEVIFESALLISTVFDGCDLTDSSFNKAQIYGGESQDGCFLVRDNCKGLEQQLFENAFGNQNTKLPEGYSFKMTS